MYIVYGTSILDYHLIFRCSLFLTVDLLFAPTCWWNTETFWTRHYYPCWI